MPSGRAWDSKNVIGTNMRNLAWGFCDEFARADIEIAEFIEEMMPDTTTNYISLWEKAVGIPDECFTVGANLGIRRLNVKRKLSLLGLQTKNDFESFASTLGLELKVRSGVDHLTDGGGYGTELPAMDIGGPNNDFATIKEARNTLVVTTLSAGSAFDYDFDFPFQTAEQLMMQCIFTNAKPAHSPIIFTTLV